MGKGRNIVGIFTRDEFSGLLESARMNASDDAEEMFVADLKDKFRAYGLNMFLSEEQEKWLRRIGEDD